MNIGTNSIGSAILCFAKPDVDPRATAYIATSEDDIRRFLSMTCEQEVDFNGIIKDLRAHDWNQGPAVFEFDGLRGSLHFMDTHTL